MSPRRRLVVVELCTARQVHPEAISFEGFFDGCEEKVTYFARLISGSSRIRQIKKKEREEEKKYLVSGIPLNRSYIRSLTVDI